MNKVILKRKKDTAVKRFHPWIFSGAIKQFVGTPEEGDWVEVFNDAGEFLGVGHYQNSSIAVRMLSFQPIGDVNEFWLERLKTAYAYRQQIPQLQTASTTCYRLVHAEGDGLPGLIIDVYNNTAVVQCHSLGMYRNRAAIFEALQALFKENLVAIYDKSHATLPKQFAKTVKNGYAFGTSAPQLVKEYGHQFRVNWETGQKTGFFIDQRENRQLLGEYAADRNVLNAFCYSGGFSVYALNAGANQVDSVDISHKAIMLTNENVTLNGSYDNKHKAYTEDVLKYLHHCPTYELMIVDPPAFAKSLKKRHNAVQGYKRLNIAALKKLVPKGIMFTFSCSQVISQQLFEDTIVAAALEIGRPVRIMHRLTQPADHPVNLFHPESNYLKGLVLQVE